MRQDRSSCGEFTGWPARALAALWVVLFAWALSIEWETPDPGVPSDDLSYSVAHADNVPPDEPGPPPLITATLDPPPAG